MKYINMEVVKEVVLLILTEGERTKPNIR